MAKYLSMTALVVLIVGYFLGVFFPGPGQAVRSKVGF